jgi:hypothetical protein
VTNESWKVFRPAIWLGFLGIAVLLVFNIVIGVAILGGAIGLGARIRSNRKRISQGLPARKPRKR